MMTNKDDKFDLRPGAHLALLGGAAIIIMGIALVAVFLVFIPCG